MKLIKPSYKVIEQPSGIEGIYQQIEMAGRTCYKSSRPEGKTAKDFVDRMITSQHYAMLEHGTVYLKMSGAESISNKYQVNPYSNVNIIYSEQPSSIYCITTHYITTNYRVLIENGWLKDLNFLCEPTEFHEKRVTVRFIIDRGISHKKFVA